MVSAHSTTKAPNLSSSQSHESPLQEIDLNLDGCDYKFALHNEKQRIIEEIFGEENDSIEGKTSNCASLTAIEKRCQVRTSDEKRKAIYNMLQQKSVDGKLKKDSTSLVSVAFGVPAHTVRRIWKRGKENEIADVSMRVKNCGRKRIQLNFYTIRDIPLHKRSTLRSLSSSTNISRTTLFRHLQQGDLRRHSNAIKPFLKEENKKARLRYCLSKLEESSIPHDPIFSGMYNTVHIDEKWFYMTKKFEKYYLLPDEEDPLRMCKSKNFIDKVMFLAAIARPRFDEERSAIFSGKIGVFPLVTQEPAKRNSVNRAAGTMETKPITSVNREVIKRYLIDKILPAIREKWPRDEKQLPIFIQQDNAKTHISRDDEDFHETAAKDGFDIRLTCQQPNSPDLNVLDLGFLAAIQSLQHQESPRNINELINAVIKAFEAFPLEKSNRIFLTLQLCMIEIMKAKGSQQYKIPHINKARLENSSEMFYQMKCNIELVQEVLFYLNQ